MPRFPNLVARAKARISRKLTTALLGLTLMFLLLGGLGLGVLASLDARTERLVDLQRRVTAYQALERNTTEVQFVIADAINSNRKRDLDAAFRRLGQISYDFDRAQFLAAEDSDVLEKISEDYQELVQTGLTVIEQLRAGDRDAARQTQSRSAARIAQADRTYSSRVPSTSGLAPIAAIDPALHDLTGPEDQHPARCDRHLLAGLGIAANAASLVADHESTK